MIPSFMDVRASLVSKLVKNPPAMWETWIHPWVGKIPWRREKLPIPVFCPREFHGLYCLWGHKESNMTEQLLPTHPSLYPAPHGDPWQSLREKRQGIEQWVLFPHSCLHSIMLNIRQCWVSVAPEIAELVQSLHL